MKTTFHRSSLGWVGLLVGLLLGGAVYAQTGGVSSQTSGSSSIAQTYQQEQLALCQEWQTLVSQGATQQQLQAWWQQNATEIEAQQQRAQALALASALQPMPLTSQVNIPANASTNLKKFLTAKASLAKARAQIHNQLLQALPSGATQEQVGAMQQQEVQIFQQEHATDLQLQTQRAQALAAESALQPIPAPGPAVIPPDASRQLQAFLSARNALAQSYAQLWNQYVNADPVVRETAMEQWQQQNSGQIEQLSTMSQALSNSTADQ